MRNFPKLLILSFILLLALSQTAFARYGLSVRKFDDKTEEHNAPAEAVTDMMITELNKAGIFDLVEREKLEYIAQEARLIESGLVDPETAYEIGKIKAARYSMTGAITLYYYNEKSRKFISPRILQKATEKTAYVMLEIRIFDNATSKEVYTSEQLGSALRAEYRSVAGYDKTYGGILASAVRDAVVKHVSAMKAWNWE